MNKNIRRSLSVFACSLSLSAVACGGSAREDDSAAQSTGALTSLALEKSHIEVSLTMKQTRTTADSPCTIEHSTFHLTYANPTFPPGTRVTAHVGHTAGHQEYIGDGYGWGGFSTQRWSEPKDLPMKATAQGFELDVEGQPYGHMVPRGGDFIDWEGVQYGPQIQFVFHVETPGGGNAWDDRLHQDYEATGPDPECLTTAESTRSLASWGPF